jgi:hypothetical protein
MPGDVLPRLLQHYLRRAVLGTSRLPITSLETPLPGFLLGQLGYFGTSIGPARGEPARDPEELLRIAWEGERPVSQRARVLELALRSLSAERVVALTRRYSDKPGPAALTNLVRQLFHQVALSPFTGLTSNLASLLRELGNASRQGREIAADLFGYLLRHLVRHLTAFDLLTFHNRGANYPDALALDCWLREYAEIIEQEPAVFQQPERILRRRALRQAWLLRKELEGLRVPDVPTSPGENIRVMPPEYPRVPEEQILRPDARTRRLFEGSPAEELLTHAARDTLRLAMQDLQQPAELQELGMATFLSRPLGAFKHPAEVDRTPLVSYEAFSRSIAGRRLKALHDLDWLGTPANFEWLSDLLRRHEVRGIHASDVNDPPRPAVVSLSDAARASPDFVILRCTGSGLRALTAGYHDPAIPGSDLRGKWPVPANARLLIRSPHSRLAHAAGSDVPLLTWYDERLNPILELGPARADGGAIRYVEWDGIEYLAEGLQVLRYWNDAGQEVDVSRDKYFLEPRFDLNE